MENKKIWQPVVDYRMRIGETIFQKQLNIKLESLKFDNVEDRIGRRKVEDGIISGKQVVKFLMVSYGRKLRIQLGILVKKLYV